MPPKAKISQEMIVSAAYEIARETGGESISARTVSQRLGCSTQPVMYHFKKIEDLKREVYQKADAYHTQYLMTFRSEEPMLDIGLNYIRFAAEEKNLFRLLFQSNEFAGKSITELAASEGLLPILEVLSQTAQVDLGQAGTIFATLALFVHGYASILANNTMKYDENRITKDLERVFTGAVYAAKEEANHADETV